MVHMQTSDGIRPWTGIPRPRGYCGKTRVIRSCDLLACTDIFCCSPYPQIPLLKIPTFQTPFSHLFCVFSISFFVIAFLCLSCVLSSLLYFLFLYSKLVLCYRAGEDSEETVSKIHIQVSSFLTTEYDTWGHG